MRNVFCILIIFFFFSNQFAHSVPLISANGKNMATNNNAPITTASSIGACVNSSFNISVNVNNFTQISAISLRLEFNPNLMTYNSYANLNSSFNGVFINSILVNSNLRIINIVWTDINPISLVNGSKIVDLNFTLLGGSPVLHFNNTSNGGGNCEYADNFGNVLIDHPDTVYYKDAIITNLTMGNPGVITGSQLVCTNQNSYNYSIPPISNALSYSWILPDNSILNTTSNSININTNLLSSGILQVKAQNQCGQSDASFIVLTIKDLPETPDSISGLFNLCVNSGNAVYTVSNVYNANSYIWTLPDNAQDTTLSNILNFLISDSAFSWNIIVKANNECGSGESINKLITINQLPVANAGIDRVVCKNDSILLVATGGIGYQWNNSIVQGMPFVVTNSAAYVVEVTDSNNCKNTDTINVNVRLKFLSIKLFLEGFYEGNGQMINVLDEFSNPVCGAENTDFVMIEIRDSMPPYDIVDLISKPVSKNGFLFSEVKCDINSASYIVIRHRNHIETWSATPVSFNSDTVFYDFTTSASKAFGDNLKQLSPDKYALFVGDVNQDDVVDLSDLVDMDTDLTNGTISYIVYDLNGDGVVDLSDLVIIDENLTNGVVVLTP